MIIELRRIAAVSEIEYCAKSFIYSDGRLRYVFVSTMNSEFTRRVVAKVSHIREATISRNWP